MPKWIIFLPILLIAAFSSTLDAQTITLNDPVNTTYVDSVKTNWTIHETGGSPQKIFMTWTYSSGTSSHYLDSVWVLTLATNSTTGNFNFDPASVLIDHHFISVSRDTAMPDGTWKVYMSYIRPASVGGATVNSTSKTKVITSTHTPPPTLISPTSASSHTSPFSLHYTLPSVPLANSVTLRFTGTTTLVMVMSTSKTVSFNLNTHNITGSSATILSASSNTLPDGTYTLSLSYQDSSGQPADSVLATDLFIQTATPPPTITSPSPSTVFTSLNPIVVKFTVPFPPKSGTEEVIFDPGVIVYKITYNNSLTDSLDIPDSDTKVPDGSNYSIIFSYQDSLGNPAAADTVTGITVHRKTITPLLTDPISKAEFSDSFLLKYNLKELPEAGTVKLVFLNATGGSPVDSILLSSAAETISLELYSLNLRAAGTAALDTLPEGTYDIYISCQDTLGNPASSSTEATKVVCQRHTTPPVLNEPVSGSTYTKIPIAYTFPESVLAGSVKLVLSGPYKISFTMNNKAVNSQVYINPFVNPGSSAPFTNGTSNSPGRFIPNGTYNVILSYHDALGNPSGFDTVTEVTVDTSSVLPISLMDFTAGYMDHQVLLNWQTASEMNNAYFVVERSLDGNLFDSLAKVSGAGNSSTIKVYSYTDGLQKTSAALLYYRLKQVDLDGHFTFSQIVSVDLNNPGEAALLTLMPNPSNGHFRISLGTTPLNPVWLSVYNSASGQLIMQQQIRSVISDIDMTGKAKGIYLVRLLYADGHAVTLHALLQ